jgi:hypothetical protein
VFFIRVKTESRTLNAVQRMLPTIVLIIPIVLKLTGVINWSWWWVLLSPIWVSGIIVLLALGGVAYLIRREARSQLRLVMHGIAEDWIATTKADWDSFGGDLGLDDGEDKPVS